jgi:hypothetical protein
MVPLPGVIGNDSARLERQMGFWGKIFVFLRGEKSTQRRGGAEDAQRKTTAGNGGTRNSGKSNFGETAEKISAAKTAVV